MPKDRIILGIDPGTIVMGYGIITSGSNNTPLVDTIGVLKLSKFSDHFVRLQRIFERTIQLIEQYFPDELAIESPFFGKNVQSMLKLGRAQGTVISAALSRSIPVFEYAPRKIKLSITGNGNASKEQVASLLTKMVKMEEKKFSTDATDALAVAVCHYFQKDKFKKEKNFRNWNDFITKNPERIISTNRKIRK